MENNRFNSQYNNGIQKQIKIRSGDSKNSGYK